MTKTLCITEEEQVRDDLSFIAAICTAIEHHIRIGDGLNVIPTYERQFLTLTRADQRNAARYQIAALRRLLDGWMAASRIAEVIYQADAWATG